MQLIDSLELWEDRHVILVTNDDILGNEFERRNDQNKFVHRFKNIGEAIGYLQQESLEIPDALYAAYETKAPILLEKLRSTIDGVLLQKYSHILDALPSPGLRRENDPWRSNSLPILDGRQDDRLRWSSLISLDFRVYAPVEPVSEEQAQAPMSGELSPEDFAALTFVRRMFELAPANATPRAPLPLDRGYATFRVYWSTRIVEPDDLDDPILEEIEAISRRWWSEPSARE
jgi:hypothetical protein